MSKKIITLLSFVFVLVVTCNAQIGIGTNTPNASSMLEITSTTSGLLIPRMSTTERIAIVSSVQGLLVYDTDLNTFWYYYSAAWHQLMSYITNNLTTNSVEIGDGTNYLKINPDGTLELIGTATVWNTFTAPANSAMQGGQPPVWAVFRNTVEAWTFSGSAVNELSYAIQMPRDWKEGSAIIPRVHWSPLSGVAGNITWNIEYTWANYQETFPATTNIFDVDTVTINNEYKHFVTTFASITPSPTQDEIGTILMIKLSRITNTHTGTVALLSFDILYESNTMGSRTPTSK